MSNTIIQSMMERRSVRSFTDQTIAPEVLESILKAAQQAPNSVNGQQISLIVVRERERIEQLAALAGGQPQVAGSNVFIVVVADFNRTATAVAMAGGEQVFDQGIEAVITGAVDAGITVEAITMAAESYGIGNVIIGGIRQNLQGVIDLLDLPEKTFPVVGISLGYPNPEHMPSVKPRIALEAYAFNEKYTDADLKPFIEIYDAVIEQYWSNVGVTQPVYTVGMKNYYGNTGRMETSDILKAQGFGLK